MTKIAALLLAVLLSASTVAMATDSPRERLHALGQRACIQVWEAGGLGGVDFAKQAPAAGLKQADYCGCVGTLFESQTAGSGDEDAGLFMQRLIANSMTTCLAESAEEAEVEDGDLAAEDFAFDPGDVQTCQMALDDTFPTPGFRASEVLARLKRTGQQRKDLCTCAARYFAAGGEPLQEELQRAQNTSVIYGSTMAGAINTCLLD